MRLLPVVLVVLLASPVLAQEGVAFTAADGVALRGKLFGSGKIVVVLAHQYNQTQSAWAPFARDLASRGYAALTFDFRGYGESGGRRVVAEIDRDVVAAVAFVRRGGAERVAVVGASMGGTAAVRTAAAAAVEAVVSLSGPASWRGLDALAVADRVTAPALFVAGTRDDGAARSAEELHARVRGPKRLLVLETAAHGTELLDGPTAVEVRRAIFDWLTEYARR